MASVAKGFIEHRLGEPRAIRLLTRPLHDPAEILKTQGYDGVLPEIHPYEAVGVATLDRDGAELGAVVHRRVVRADYIGVVVVRSHQSGQLSLARAGNVWMVMGVPFHGGGQSADSPQESHQRSPVLTGLKPMSLRHGIGRTRHE